MFHTNIPKNKRGFMLLLVLMLISFFLLISSTVVWYYNRVSDRVYVANKKLQASNYAVEWTELMKGYILSALNRDRISGWKNIVVPLNGKYIVRYDNGYWIEQKESEIIEQTTPYAVDYKRTIDISDESSTDEKRITVTVDYGEKDKLQYSTTVTNLYGK